MLFLLPQVFLPPPALKFFGAEHSQALSVGFQDKSLVHSDLYSTKPVKRVFHFGRLCTAMKSYDCTLIRLKQSLDELMRVTDRACLHVDTVDFPNDEYVLMQFSEPHTLLVNMPIMKFCAQCGQLLSFQHVTPIEEADRAVGYTDTVL